jgi:proline dehydrogenase
MLDATSKAVFHGLAQISTLQRLASKYGMARGSGFARRFIAGETVDEAVTAVQRLREQGLLLTLDYLGESVSSAAAAAAAAADYVKIIAAIVASGIERNISLKLTQLGLDVDRATAVDNMRRILEPADAMGSSCVSIWRIRPTPMPRWPSSKPCGCRVTGKSGP